MNIENFVKSILFFFFKWISFLGGTGGHGLPQYGGHGGSGGRVILKTPVKDNRKNPTNLYTLFKKNFKSDPKKQRLIAGPGVNSAKSRLNGASGEDAILTVRKVLDFFFR